jgi:hypothetical protein
MEKLSETAQELGKILYEEAAKKQAKTPPTGEGEAPKGKPAAGAPEEGEVRRKGGDDVIDAEFEAK